MPNVSKEIDIKEGLDDYRSSKDEESSAVDLEANRQDLMRDIQEMIFPHPTVGEAVREALFMK